MAPRDWASLPSDLVRSVADLFLATRDLDYYMSLRAMCSNWRAATDDPHGPDPRFSPRGWVLVTSLGGDDDAGDDHAGLRCLFLHVDNGRFLWKDMPMLLDYTVFASTEDGHLALEPASRNSRICLLNPITGRLVRFPVTPARFVGDRDFSLRLRDFGPAISLMVKMLYNHFGFVSSGCMDPTWDAVFSQESFLKAESALYTYAAMVPFKGRAYSVNEYGLVAAVEERSCWLDRKPVLTGE